MILKVTRNCLLKRERVMSDIRRLEVKRKFGEKGETLYVWGGACNSNLVLGNHLSIFLKSEENVCRNDRLQDLPDSHRLLASSSANERIISLNSINQLMFVMVKC
jgi:hypothetical protein